MPGAIIVGAGPGLGASVARRLAREGLSIGMIARSGATVDLVLSELADVDALGVAADVTDEAALRGALEEIVGRFGIPDLLVYNAAVIQRDALGELTARQQLDAWAVNVVGAITAVTHLAQRMAQNGGGTIVITGGMPEPSPEVASLSLGKAGVRTLTQLLAKAYGPAGLHAATVTVAGPVASGTRFDPEDIAEHYWRLHIQPPGAWEQEIVHTGEHGDSGGAGLAVETVPSPAKGDGRTAEPASPQINVLLISGSTRTGSTNTAVLRTAADLAPAGIGTALLEGIGDLPLFNPDDDAEGAVVHPAVAAMRAEVARADAILICTPEYAGALPAAMKNVLEWTIGDAGTYDKPVAWINASGRAAPTGAADAHESLAKVLRYAGADVVADACARIPTGRDLIDKRGLISDARARAQILAALQQLIDHAARTTRSSA